MSGPRSYPVPRPPAGGTDDRFTFGLAYDMAKVLVAHGYPELSGGDFVKLQQALFGFIYAPADDQAAGNSGVVVAGGTVNITNSTIGGTR